MQNLEKALKKVQAFEPGLREIVEEELVMLRSFDKNIQAEVHNGFAVYKTGDSDLVLATIHNGSFVPETVELKQSPEERRAQEDLFTGELYLPLFLNHGGIWITSHLSRYLVDMNRRRGEAVLGYESDETGSNLAAGDEEELRRFADEFYSSFYAASMKVLTGKFLFSGHSMNPEKNGIKRGDFCLIYNLDEEGLPLKQKLEEQGFRDVRINDPFVYSGGHYRFYFDLITNRSVEFETNKRLYLDENFHKKKSFDDVSQRISLAVADFLKSK